MTTPGGRQAPLCFMRGGRLYQIAAVPDGYVGLSNGQVKARANSRAEVARALIQDVYWIADSTPRREPPYSSAVSSGS